MLPVQGILLEGRNQQGILHFPKVTNLHGTAPQSLFQLTTMTRFRECDLVVS